jgi:two-component system, LytTR family, sensor kinase
MDEQTACLSYSLFTIFYSPFSFLYSYGDSTGLTPDFPFNPRLYTGKPNLYKCRMTDKLSGKSYQQPVLSAHSGARTIHPGNTVIYFFLCSMAKEKLLSVLAHSLGWLLFFGLLMGFLYNANPELGVMELLSKPAFLFFAAIYIFSYYFNTVILVPGLYLRKHYFLYFTVIALLFAAIFFIKPFDTLLAGFIPDGGMDMPKGPPPPGFEDMPRPGFRPPREMNGWLKTDIVSCILFVMVTSLGLALCLIKQWRFTEQRALKAETEKANAELSFLKAQINPHFLFNTLNNIYSMVVVKHEHAADAVMKLSNIMRYITDEIRTDLVPLESEISCINDYIDLQRLRLGGKTTVEVDMNGNTGSMQVAPLLLMTFVENAFKFGVSNHESSVIHLEVIAEEPLIRFYCRNKLFPVQSHAERSGIGIPNARKRLEHLYPDRYKLDIREEDGVYAVQLILQS